MTLTVFGKKTRDWYEDYYAKNPNFAENRLGKYVVSEGTDRFVYSTDDKHALLIWLDANGLSTKGTWSNGGNSMFGTWYAAKIADLCG